MKEKEKRIELLDYQKVSSILFIISLIISLILIEDERNKINNKKTIENKKAQNIALLQSIIVLVVSFSFLYIATERYKLSKETKEKDEGDLFVQIETSLLSVISSIIGFYIVYKNYSSVFTVAELEDIF